MKLKLPFKLKVDNIIKNGSSFEGKIVFHDEEYHVNINTQKNEKTAGAESVGVSTSWASPPLALLAAVITILDRVLCSRTIGPAAHHGVL